MKSLFSLRHYLAIFLSVFLITGCGGDAEKPQNDNAADKSATSESTNDAPKVTELVISGNDLMKFDKAALKAKAGSKIVLTLKHTGKMSKEAMGHNFVLLKRGVNLTEFAKRALDAKDNDYIPAGDDIIAHTKLLGGGESDQITFDAPPKGAYDYLCTFPGHFGLMQGKLLVQ